MDSPERPGRYRVEFTRSAKKELQALPKAAQIAVARAIDGLQNNPRPRGVKKLRGAEGLYRVRAGDYRVIYTIEDRIVFVTIVRVANRKDVYGDL